MVIDNFSRHGWTLPLKKKNAQTIKDYFGNIPKTSKRKPNLIETDRGRDFYNSFSRNV